MTTGLSSSELCNVCRSSGFRDFVYLCTNSAGCSNFDDNPFMSLSPAGTSSTKLTEFQFFRQDDDVSGLFDDCARDKPAGDGEILPVAPAAKHSDFQANFYNPRPLTLGVCCNAASSLGSHPGSPPVDISVKGQASSTTVSFSGIKFTNASTGDIREAYNPMNSEHGDPTTGREVPFSSIKFTDASTGDIREAYNPMNSEQGDPTMGREVSSSGITFTDASTSDIREVRNLMNSEQGDPTTRREASMLRYREKKKRRRFEKKIRYASRKAYAEARPRIKGRFAKRTETREPTAPAYPQDMLGLEWFHH